METNTKKRPIDTLRDFGGPKASIWQDDGPNGSRFSVTLARIWRSKEDGSFHDSTTFSGQELLQLSRLLHKAYDRIAELKTAKGEGDDS
jgi:hypothetical protein